MAAEVVAVAGPKTGPLDLTATTSYRNLDRDPKNTKEKRHCIVCGRWILKKTDQGHEHRQAHFVPPKPGSHPPAGCPGMRACGAGYSSEPSQYERFERLALWILYRRPDLRAEAPTFVDKDQLVGMISGYFRAWWPTVPTLHAIAAGPAGDAAFQQEVARLAAAL